MVNLYKEITPRILRTKKDHLNDKFADVIGSELVNYSDESHWCWVLPTTSQYFWSEFENDPNKLTKLL